jgi:hypothetical protein
VVPLALGRPVPLIPGEVYACDVEIVTSCIVVPSGWRLALTVRGKDYEYEGELSEFARKFHYGTRGTGGMTHNDPGNRPRGRRARIVPAVADHPPGVIILVRRHDLDCWPLPVRFADRDTAIGWGGAVT